MVTPRPAAKPAADKPDFASLLAGAKLPERTVPVCLRGDLVAEHEAADRELARLAEMPAAKFSGIPGVGELRQRIQALEDQMRSATYDFRFRAIIRKRWHALVGEHQPRPDNDRDAAIGVNTDTFFEALVKVSVVDPEMGIDVGAYFKELLEARSAGNPSPVLPDGNWPQLFDALTDRQFDDLADAAWGLNRRDVHVPFSPAAWRQSQSSEPA